MNDKISVAQLIHDYSLSIQCCGTWFMVYRGDTPPTDPDDALAYELSVTSAVFKAVNLIKGGAL